MSFNLFSTKDNTPNNRDWKDKNKGYLRQLQKFLDVAENIEKEDLKMSIIAEMLKCDRILTELAEKKMKEIQKENE